VLASPYSLRARTTRRSIGCSVVYCNSTNDRPADQYSPCSSYNQTPKRTHCNRVACYQSTNDTKMCPFGGARDCTKSGARHASYNSTVDH
jgi:hypothetical protein